MDLPPDILVMMALDMDTVDALQLCNTSKKLNKAICNNPNYWRQKIKRDFKNFPSSTSSNKYPKDYYILLYNSYIKGYYDDSYKTAQEKSYDDLIQFMKDNIIWGTLDHKGRLLIHHVPQHFQYKPRGRRYGGTLCRDISSTTVYFLMLHLEVKGMFISLSEKCKMIKEELYKKGLIFPNN